MELVDLLGEVLVRAFQVDNLKVEIAVLFGEVHVALEHSVIILYLNAKPSVLFLKLLDLLLLRFDHLSLSGGQITGYNWLRLHLVLFY